MRASRTDLAPVAAATRFLAFVRSSNPTFANPLVAGEQVKKRKEKLLSQEMLVSWTSVRPGLRFTIHRDVARLNDPIVVILVARHIVRSGNVSSAFSQFVHDDDDPPEINFKKDTRVSLRGRLHSRRANSFELSRLHIRRRNTRRSVQKRNRSI